MSDNPAFQPDQIQAGPKKSVPTITIEEEGTNTAESPGCCSWTKMCDVLGNRQGRFISALRPLRNQLIITQQVLLSFRVELERGIKTKRTTSNTSHSVKKVVGEINKVTTHVDLNIPPDEHALLRKLSYDLAELWRVIEELSSTAPELPRNRSNSTLAAKEIGEVRKDSIGTEIRDVAIGTSTAVDEHSLKDRITRCSDGIESVIVFIDKKTQRRWWLRDVINFLKLVIKLALFISAAVSVAYHEKQIAPIVTLIIAIVQGVVDALDQYFLKHTNPEEIKLTQTAQLTSLQKRA